MHRSVPFPLLQFLNSELRSESISQSNTIFSQISDCRRGGTWTVHQPLSWPSSYKAGFAGVRQPQRYGRERPMGLADKRFKPLTSASTYADSFVHINNQLCTSKFAYRVQQADKVAVQRKCLLRSTALYHLSYSKQVANSLTVKMEFSLLLQSAGITRQQSSRQIVIFIPTDPLLHLYPLLS